jgi:hypothetical protein
MSSSPWTSVASDIGDLLGTSAPLVGLSIIMALVGFACWRTRSIHLVITRIWRLIHGRKTLSDREIDRFIREREHLIQFRFYTGLKTRTLAQAKRLIAWSKKHGEELGDVAACGELFDLEACRLRVEKIPSIRWKTVMLVNVCLCSGVIAASVIASLSDGGLLRMRESGVHFTLSAGRARGLFGAGTTTPEDCSAGPRAAAQSMGITEAEAAAICDLFQRSDLSTFIAATVHQQRVAFAFLAVIGLALGTAGFRTLRSALVATSMGERLAEAAPVQR